MRIDALLSPAQFEQACAALPLVSIDLVVTNPQGQLLLGLRSNAPARGWWFTPGGRIRKNEPFQQAMARIALDELGLPADLLGGAVLMGAWDHFYPDSAFSPAVSTHYVNMPHRLQLSWQDISRLTLQPDQQHTAWQWLDAAQAETDETVHPYVRAYAGRVSIHFPDREQGCQQGRQ